MKQEETKEGICPRCGRQMLDGNMLSGRQTYFIWLPAGEESPRHLLRMGFLVPRKETGMPEEGMLLCRMSYDFVKHPTWHCPQCKLVLMDYAREHER